MFFNKKNKDDDLDFDKDMGAPFDDKTSKDDLLGDTNKTSEFDNFTSNDYSAQSESLSALHSQGHSQQPSQMQATTNMDSKEFQIMNSKLDAIKSEMDALMQHVLKLEREINSNKKKPMW